MARVKRSSKKKVKKYQSDGSAVPVTDIELEYFNKLSNYYNDNGFFVRQYYDGYGQDVEGLNKFQDGGQARFANLDPFEKTSSLPTLSLPSVATSQLQQKTPSFNLSPISNPNSNRWSFANPILDSNRSGIESYRDAVLDYTMTPGYTERLSRENSEYDSRAYDRASRVSNTGVNVVPSIPGFNGVYFPTNFKESSFNNHFPSLTQVDPRTVPGSVLTGEGIPSNSRSPMALAEEFFHSSVDGRNKVSGKMNNLAAKVDQRHRDLGNINPQAADYNAEKWDYIMEPAEMHAKSSVVKMLMNQLGIVDLTSEGAKVEKKDIPVIIKELNDAKVDDFIINQFYDMFDVKEGDIKDEKMQEYFLEIMNDIADNSKSSSIRTAKDGGYANTPYERSMGVLAGKNKFKFKDQGPHQMTMNPMGQEVPVPLAYYGYNDNELVDSGIALPGQDFQVKGNKIIEQPIMKKGGKILKKKRKYPKAQVGRSVNPQFWNDINVFSQFDDFTQGMLSGLHDPSLTPEQQNYWYKQTEDRRDQNLGMRSQYPGPDYDSSYPMHPAYGNVYNRNMTPLNSLGSVESFGSSTPYSYDDSYNGNYQGVGVPYAPAAQNPNVPGISQPLFNDVGTPSTGFNTNFMYSTPEDAPPLEYNDVASGQGSGEEVNDPNDLRWYDVPYNAAFNLARGLIAPAEVEPNQYNEYAAQALAGLRDLKYTPDFTQAWNAYNNATQGIRNSSTSVPVMQARQASSLANTQRALNEEQRNAATMNVDNMRNYLKSLYTEGNVRSKERARVTDRNQQHKAAKDNYYEQGISDLDKWTENLRDLESARQTNEMALASLNVQASNFKVLKDENGQMRYYYINSKGDLVPTDHTLN